MDATLLALQQRKEGKDPSQTLHQVLDDLITADLILKHSSTGELRATPLGCAAFKGKLAPCTSFKLRIECRHDGQLTAACFRDARSVLQKCSFFA